MTLLTTPIFYFHKVISALTTPLTIPTLTLLLLKTSLWQREPRPHTLKIILLLRQAAQWEVTILSSHFLRTGRITFSSRGDFIYPWKFPKENSKIWQVGYIQKVASLLARAINFTYR